MSFTTEHPQHEQHLPRPLNPTFPSQPQQNRSSKPRPRPPPQQMGHFDPDELTRRLYIVLADQNAHAERKRRAREARDSPKPEYATSTTTGRRKQPPFHHHHAVDSVDYHHIPREAAKQFTHTTTVELPLKHHTARSSVAPESSLPPGELARALRYSQSHGAQLQRVAAMERAAREEGVKTRYTFREEVLRMAPGTVAEDPQRRNSTSGAVESFDSKRSSVMAMETVVDKGEEGEDAHPRVDWTQSDEGRTRPKLLLTPFLRKADSLWGLRGRLVAKQQEKERGHERKEPLKTQRSGFFGKFMRS
ncbi:hypothetical protein OQA88_12309 [Cercophora sp. LCS_1]